MLDYNRKFLGVSVPVYLATFFVLFVVSYAVYGIVSVFKDGKPMFGEDNGVVKEITEPAEKFYLPERVIIPKIGVEQPILNPESKLVADLDRELLKGVVRYPDSGLLGENKNMFLFGHSTGFKVVKNQAFKAFNRLNELEAGDDVILVSGNTAYLYRVVSSNEVSAGKALVEFGKGQTLTLSTCNTFGAKEARFIVESKFIKSYLLEE